MAELTRNNVGGRQLVMKRALIILVSWPKRSAKIAVNVCRF